MIFDFPDTARALTVTALPTCTGTATGVEAAGGWVVTGAVAGGVTGVDGGGVTGVVAGGVTGVGGGFSIGMAMTVVGALVPVALTATTLKS